jgi:hypothetical protein
MRPGGFSHCKGGYMQDIRFILPDYYRIVECRDDRWYFKKVNPFYTRLPIQIDFQDIKLLYGISQQQIVNELFQMKNGEIGFYLVNLRQKRYYYCGTDSKSVKAMLHSLGIGRNEPTRGNRDE